MFNEYGNFQYQPKIKESKLNEQRAIVFVGDASFQETHQAISNQHQIK